MMIPDVRNTERPRGDSRPPWWSAPLEISALVLAMVVIGDLSIHLSPGGSHVAAWWPAAGVAVIAMSITPDGWRWATALGIFGASVMANIDGGRDLFTAVGFAAANTAEAVLVIWWLTRGTTGKPRLHNLDDLLRLVVATAIGAVAAGTIAAIVVVLNSEGTFIVAWRAVTASHASAVLLIAPLGMSVPTLKRQAGRAERIAQWVTLFTAMLLIFAPSQSLPLAFLPFPALAWGAIRLSPREVSVQLLLLGTITTILTTRGHGPFAFAVTGDARPPELVGTLMQANLVAFALVSLPLMLVKAQRLQALDEVTRSSALTKSILQATTGTGILGSDPDGRVTFFNPGAEAVTGYAADEVVDVAHVELSLDQDSQIACRFITGRSPKTIPIEGLIGAALDKDGSATRDWMLTRKDGELRTVSVTVTRRHDADGGPLGYLGVVDDVTERRRHEMRVATALAHEKQLVERLAQVDETKNDFIASVSHELRTPITSIIGYSQLMLTDDSGALPAMHQEILNRIERNGRRLMGLIEDMLTMSQVELGSFRFKSGVVNLQQVLGQAIESVADSLPEHNLTLERQLEETPVEVTGDFDKLERAFTNLLTNAVKFSHPGDSITVSLSSDSTNAIIVVSDTGVGISDEDQVHLFDRFFRGTDARERAIQGAGLGLTIVNSIITGHSGTIAVDSTLGQGTEFSIRLPLRGEAQVLDQRQAG